MTHVPDVEKAGELASATPDSNEFDENRTSSAKPLSLNEANGDRRSENLSSTGGEEFEVKWDGPDDPGCPKSMSKTRKWLCTWVVSIGSLCV